MRLQPRRTCVEHVAAGAAGRLQVELAQLRYRLPRLTGRGRSLSRQGGGIGTRGPGETQLEKDRFAAALRRRQLSLVLAGKLKAHEATELKAIFEQ